MAELTLKKMDAATNKIVEKVFESCLDPENAVEYEKALKIAAEDGFLAGMKAAASLTKECAYSQDNNWYIRAAVRRLRKEIADAK